MLRTTTIGSQVYRTLRKAILDMTFRPGEKLSEAQLAERYHVSRAPIRDAIRTLEQEGFVEVRPQVGTIVSAVSSAVAANICQIRVLLEPYAAGIAAKTLTAQDLSELETAFRALGALDGRSPQRTNLIFDLDLRLHRTIWASCQNGEIAKILNGYIDQMNRIRLATAAFADRLQPSETEMRAILAALKSRNPAGARKAMHTHILNIKRAIDNVLRTATPSSRP